MCPTCGGHIQGLHDLRSCPEPCSTPFGISWILLQSAFPCHRHSRGSFTSLGPFQGQKLISTHPGITIEPRNPGSIVRRRTPLRARDRVPFGRRTRGVDPGGSSLFRKLRALDTHPYRGPGREITDDYRQCATGRDYWSIHKSSLRP